MFAPGALDVPAEREALESTIAAHRAFTALIDAMQAFRADLDDPVT